jgi:3-methyladenine DNA glycosylase AlkC
MASGFSLKDQLFNIDKTRYLAGRFSAANPAFDAPGFEARVMARLPDLELKERITWIADCLNTHLPGTLPEVAPTLRAALPEPLDPTLVDDDFGDFIFAPLGEWVVALGLEEHPDLSLDLLAEITQRFSMEWAIRPFLNRWPDLVLERMQGWTRHDNYHVRRLVSEGTRPRLPWGQAVALKLDDPLPLLDYLHADPTRYVTRSVANHLNDITKKDPDLAMDRLAAWGEADTQDPHELRWMTSHALRGLVKSGNSRAMVMLGYDPQADIQTRLHLNAPAVRIGDMLGFSCHLMAKELTPVLVDYRLHFIRPGGKVSAKVFKLKQAHVGPDGLVLEKRHRLKGDATTFTLVPGLHRIEVMVNGVVQDVAEFDLLG